VTVSMAAWVARAARGSAAELAVTRGARPAAAVVVRVGSEAKERQAAARAEAEGTRVASWAGLQVAAVAGMAAEGETAAVFAGVGAAEVARLEEIQEAQRVGKANSPQGMHTARPGHRSRLSQR